MNIVIDMGGTNTRVGFSKNLREFDFVERFPTPQSQEESHKLFAQALSKNSENIEKIIFGIAGTVHYPTNKIVNVTNIEWINNMSAEEITGINGYEIKSYNDAELAGLAESYQPQAANFENVAYITISTGVGGTIIRNKKPDTNLLNYEPGHIIIDKSTQSEPADNIRGSFESLCSGTGFFKRNKIQPQDCTDTEIWKNYGKDLADGLYSLTLLWQPDAIILGGSMTNQWNLFYDTLIERYQSYPEYYKQPVILRSELRDMNGLLGGLKVLYSA